MLKKNLYILLFLFFSKGFYCQEISTINLWDKEQTKIKLTLPAENLSPSHIVLFVHGTGPSTYLDKRGKGENSFNYYDFFANEFVKHDVGFVSYNRRGVTISENPPMYNDIDSLKYNKYTPLNEAKDIESIIGALSKRKNLKQTKFILLGWSEGTIVSTLIAERKKVNVEALFLCGYANENMFDIIQWQLSGKSSMVNICKYFDLDSNKVITREEYESENEIATKYRTKVFQNTDFSQFDIVKDSVIDYQDFEIQLKPYYETLLNMIHKKNNSWIWNNYFQVTLNWLEQHFQTEANKSRMLRLNLPIYIFHGEEDSNTPIEGVTDIKQRFNSLGKSNLKCYTFKGHNHDLNFMQWVKKNEIPNGIAKIFKITDQHIKL